MSRTRTKGPDPEALRARLRQLGQLATMREIAGQAGLSYVTLYRFVDGKVTPRPWTLRRIEAWLAEPGEGAVAARFRDDLRRLLGSLPARDRREIEREIAGVVGRAFRVRQRDEPMWVASLARKARG